MLIRLLVVLSGLFSFFFIPYYYGKLWLMVFGMDEEIIILKWMCGLVFLIITGLIFTGGYMIIHWVITGS